MSKWFGITVVVLLALWLSLLSLAQLKLNAATQTYGAIIREHENDLLGIKLRMVRMARPMVQAKPVPQFVRPGPPLARHRRRPGAVGSKSGSGGIELTPERRCW